MNNKLLSMINVIKEYLRYFKLRKDTHTFCNKQNALNFYSLAAVLVNLNELVLVCLSKYLKNINISGNPSIAF